MSTSKQKDTAADSNAALGEGVNFESALNELENLVAQMEGGDLSLDESLKAFEKGIALTRACQTALQEAELKVQTLTDDGELAEFEADDS